MRKQLYLGLCFGLLVTTLALPAAAQEKKPIRVEFTPFASYAFEGNFNDGFYDTNYFGDSLSVDEGSGYGLIVGFPLGRHFTLEVSYSRQDTEIFYDGGLFGERETLLPLDVEYLHGGFAYNFGAGQVQPFVLFSAGVTQFSPQGNYDSESRFSAAIGGGAKIYFTDNIGIRLQGRVLSTLVDDNEEAFCDRRDCYYYDTSSYLYQAEVSAGLILAF